jgi:hypothetical protein
MWSFVNVNACAAGLRARQGLPVHGFTAGGGSGQLCYHVIRGSLFIMLSLIMPQMIVLLMYYRKSIFPSSLNRTCKATPHRIRIAVSPWLETNEIQAPVHQSRHSQVDTSLAAIFLVPPPPRWPGPLRCVAPGNHSARELQSRTPHAQLSSATSPQLHSLALSPFHSIPRAGGWRAGAHRAAAGTALAFSLIRDPALSSPALHCIARG